VLNDQTIRQESSQSSCVSVGEESFTDLDYADDVTGPSRATAGSGKPFSLGSITTAFCVRQDR